MMTREEVRILMSSSKNEKEWDANCDKVKEAFQGSYPSFWFEAIIMTGLLAKVKLNW